MIGKFSGICPKTNRIVEIKIDYIYTTSFDKPNVYTKDRIESCPFKQFGCKIGECPIFRTAPDEIKPK